MSIKWLSCLGYVSFAIGQAPNPTWVGLGRCLSCEAMVRCHAQQRSIALLFAAVELYKPLTMQVFCVKL